MPDDLPPARALRLGTRGSPLALVQANMVVSALRAAPGGQAQAIEIVIIKTSGDRIQDRALAEIGGKALWTKELDRALLDGDIDFAVHSMKDVETIRPDTIAIAAMLPRADVRDRIIGAPDIAALRQGAVIGTSSPRRGAQLRRLRPDVSTVMFRGNVATRLAKLEAGEADATLLAAAGLERLGQPEVGAPVPVEVMLPAPAQGAIGIETLADNREIRRLLEAISDADTVDCVMAERALLRVLGGTCHSPVAALASLEGGTMRLRAELLTPDGRLHVSTDRRFARGDENAAGRIARELLDAAPAELRACFTG